MTRNRKDKMPITSILVRGLICFLLVHCGPVPVFSQKGQTATVPAIGVKSFILIFFDLSLPYSFFRPGRDRLPA